MSIKGCRSLERMGRCILLQDKGKDEKIITDYTSI